MTELNDFSEAGAELDDAELDGAADWPAGTSRTGDPAVDSVLVRLEEIPGHPVAEHSQVYAGLHDALLEALNADPGSAAHAIASASGRSELKPGGA